MPTPNSNSCSGHRAASHDDQWGLVASTLLHLAAIAAIAAVATPSATRRTPPAIETDWNLSTSEEVAVIAPSQLVSAIPDRHNSSALPRAIASLSSPSEPVVAFDPRVPQSIGPYLPAVDVQEALPPTSSSTAANGATAGDSGATGGSGGTGTGGGFFPIESTAQRIVFVVDTSKSMGHHYPGPAKTRLGRVKVELWRTIYGLSPTQSFFIVFFNTRAWPMPATAFRSGGEANQTDLFRWTTEVRPDGDTDPYSALLLAMQLQPDVVYFLTDGEFKYTVVRDATRANTGRVPIHTISLGDPAGAKFLQELADKNGGSYRHFTAEDDRYWEDLPASTASNAAARPAAAVDAASRAAE